MKKAVLVLILTLTLAYSKVQSDRAAHAFVGLGIYAACFFTKGLLDSMDYDTSYITPTTCLVPVIAAGAGKELYDKQHPENHTAEWGDFGATVAIPFGTWVIVRF